MYICGLQKTTLLDFPNKLACTVFTPGCNFRCPFCYNSDIVHRSVSKGGITEKDFFEFLRGRSGVLDGVVVCGGEPTLQRDLKSFAQRVKNLGFDVKIDTNGSRPQVLENLLVEGLVDFVSLDIKNVLEDDAYSKACGFVDFKPVPAVLESMDILFSSGGNFEVRTTVVPTIHDEESLLKLARQLKDFAQKRDSLENMAWVLQSFEPRDCLDPTFNDIEPFGKTRMKEFLELTKQVLATVKLRGVS